MSERINDGGPAFPVTVADGKLDCAMTLRDWFAGQALMLAGASALAAAFEGKTPPMSEAGMARCAYATADAMLTERTNNKGRD